MSYPNTKNLLNTISEFKTVKGKNEMSHSLIVAFCKILNIIENDVSHIMQLYFNQLNYSSKDINLSETKKLI
jgi:hypothetical protein